MLYGRTLEKMISNSVG